jgi:hypothetical protein
MLILPPKYPNRTPAPVQNLHQMLQKVLAASWPRSWNMSLVIANCTKQLECGFEILSDFTDRGQVSASVAVIWRTPHGDHILVVKVVFVALVDQLMSACDQREIINMAELIGHSVSE